MVKTGCVESFVLDGKFLSGNWSVYGSERNEQLSAEGTTRWFFWYKYWERKTGEIKEPLRLDKMGLEN